MSIVSLLCRITRDFLDRYSLVPILYSTSWIRLSGYTHLLDLSTIHYRQLLGPLLSAAWETRQNDLHTEYDIQGFCLDIVRSQHAMPVCWTTEIGLAACECHVGQ